MKCTECGTDNTGGQIYCRTCGHELDLTYDQVHGSVTEQIKGEKEAFTVEQTRQFLVLSTFLMILSIVFKSATGPVPNVETPPTFTVTATQVRNPPPPGLREFQLPENFVVTKEQREEAAKKRKEMEDAGPPKEGDGH